jgi:hypothetical protein
MDLEKRIRRVDKETASLVGVWVGRTVAHFDLFPETALSAMQERGEFRYHQDALRRVVTRGERGGNDELAAPELSTRASQSSINDAVRMAAPLLLEHALTSRELNLPPR